jgi:plastocyanin
MRRPLLHSLVIAVCVGAAIGQIAPVLIGQWAWAAQSIKVSQRGRAFAVRALEIARGDTLQFVNDDEYLHQIYVKSGTMNFDSNEQAPGETISVRFAETGTFDVRCHIHPTMLLTVTVK